MKKNEINSMADLINKASLKNYRNKSILTKQNDNLNNSLK